MVTEDFCKMKAVKWPNSYFSHKKKTKTKNKKKKKRKEKKKLLFTIHLGVIVIEFAPQEKTRLWPVSLYTFSFVIFLVLFLLWIP